MSSRSQVLRGSLSGLTRSSPCTSCKVSRPNRQARKIGREKHFTVIRSPPEHAETGHKVASPRKKRAPQIDVSAATSGYIAGVTKQLCSLLTGLPGGKEGLETELGLGAAQIDLFDLVDVAVPGGLHLGLIELRLSRLDLDGSGEGFVTVYVREDRVVALEFHGVLTRLQLDAANVAGMNESDLVSLGAQNAETGQSKHSKDTKLLHDVSILQFVFLGVNQAKTPINALVMKRQRNRLLLIRFHRLNSKDDEGECRGYSAFS